MYKTDNIGENLIIFLKEKFGDSYGQKRKWAESIEMSPQNLNQYLKNKRLPGAEILIKLAKIGCDLNLLLTGESLKSSNTANEHLEMPYNARILELEKKLQMKYDELESKLTLRMDALQDHNQRLFEENGKLKESLIELGYENQMLRVLNRKVDDSIERDKIE